ncbi:hypothetical protein LTR62_000027 [Meristemomyces frigidus]|uniref:Uncharacterized protein n=1 Tax=Meristemomyces frigidus TaxID=1508187 RepID=A0AAN7TQW5_9PEZI|nr:hypothetical protein LTR62_000027 [Meristemomyces frigidus]
MPADSNPIPAHVTLATILQMILRNGISNACHSPRRPSTSDQLNKFRSILLQHPFFDRTEHPEDLTPHVPTEAEASAPPPLCFADLVVLMARTLRILMWQAPLTQWQLVELSVVRREALREGFFDRGRREAFGGVAGE